MTHYNRQPRRHRHEGGTVTVALAPAFILTITLVLTGATA